MHERTAITFTFYLALILIFILHLNPVLILIPRITFMYCKLDIKLYHYIDNYC